jgi:hypothetical protein
VLEPVGETEVCDYHVPVSVEEEVFELEVAVNDLFLVDVPDAGDELTEEFARILLLQVAVCQDMVEEFTARRVFEDDTDVLVRFDNVVKPDDVRMFESLKDAKRTGKPAESVLAGPNKALGDKVNENAP